jgi:deoxyribose-phosphate aldolase
MTGIGQISGPKELARFLDYSLLRADATREDVARVCGEAREHAIGRVCLNTSRVALATILLEDSGVKLVAAVGFPYGTMDADVKRFETEVAVDSDAHFIEMMANIGRLKDGDHAFLLRELRDVVEAADERPVSVIVEAPLLSPEQLHAMCQIVMEAGANGIVTSTGVEGRNACLEDVRRIREIVDESFGVKAVGGIADGATALVMIDAGATRIGATDVTEILKSCAVA